MRSSLFTFFAIALIAVTSPANARHATLPPVTGAWYVGGNPQRACLVVRTTHGLTARNENGDVTTLERRGRHNVFAANWESGIVGTVEGDRLLWRNGTWWTRSRWMAPGR